MIDKATYRRICRYNYQLGLKEGYRKAMLRKRRMKRRPLIRYKKVIIESPYRGDVERNMAYLKLAMLDSISRGEAPSASHKLYTDILNDNDEEERRLGLDLGFAWLQAADLVAFYTDFGMSSGMSACLEDLRTFRFRVPFEMRKVSLDALHSIGITGC